MKTKVLLIAISVFFASCRQTPLRMDLTFHTDKAVVCDVDTVRDFDVSKLVNQKNKVNLKILKNESPLTISDLSDFRDTIFGFNIEPASAAKGLTISGNAVFCYDKQGKLSEIFFHSLDNSRIFVWPDKYAKLSKASNKDNKIVVEGLIAKMRSHYQYFLKYMATPDIPGAVDLQLLHPKSIYMLGVNECPESRNRFDISSLTGKGNRMYTIADKPDTRDIYYVDTLKGKFFINLAVKTSNITSEDLDIEAVDVVDNRFIIADEIHDLLYIQKGEGANEFEQLKIDFTVLGEDMAQWSGNNAGIEGMTVDNKNQLLYIAKERNPRRMFVYDLKTKQLSAPFDNSILPNDGDISDLCFENGFLYILDRQNCCVRKFDVKTQKSSYVSFKKFSNNKKEHNYHADFGMAEALWLTQDAIFVGFDNNADPVTKFGEQVGLEKGSTRPSIFVFKRPKGF